MTETPAQYKTEQQCPACDTGLMIYNGYDYVCDTCEHHTNDPSVGVYEMVNHPKHYNNRGGIECKDYIQWLPGLLAIVGKQLWRAGDKPGADIIQDLEKAIVYIDFEIERLNNYRKHIWYPKYPDVAPNADNVFALFEGLRKLALENVHNAAFKYTSPDKAIALLEGAKTFIGKEIINFKGSD